MIIFSKTALISSGWANNIRLKVERGKIVSLIRDTKPQDGDYKVDILLPALSNLHSHSFQRGMAGLTEKRQHPTDSFWTWREVMYKFVDLLTPNDIQAIAAQCFMEMQMAGYSAVGEFHYLHHGKNGQKYDKLSELSQQIFAAADNTGIGLTHLPVLYSYGGLDKRPLNGGQKRFGSSLECYLNLWSECAEQIKTTHQDWALGIAPHSLRATSQDQLNELTTQITNTACHIHIAEQTQEIEEVQNATKARPVEWLYHNIDVDDKWCLIHATHLTDSELTQIVNSKAVVGLCPITEANLGDGIFKGAKFHSLGGRYGIGSDSNVRIALGEELRTLEYSQRLKDQKRTTMVTGLGHNGHALYTTAALGGAQALDRTCGKIEVGYWADLLGLNENHPNMIAMKNDNILDALIFSAGEAQLVSDLWSAGRHMVQQGRHINAEQISKNYRNTISRIVNNL